MIEWAFDLDTGPGVADRYPFPLCWMRPNRRIKRSILAGTGNPATPRKPPPEETQPLPNPVDTKPPNYPKDILGEPNNPGQVKNSQVQSNGSDVPRMEAGG